MLSKIKLQALLISKVLQVPFTLTIQSECSQELGMCSKKYMNQKTCSLYSEILSKGISWNFHQNGNSIFEHEKKLQLIRFDHDRRRNTVENFVTLLTWKDLILKSFQKNNLTNLRSS